MSLTGIKAPSNIQPVPVGFLKGLQVPLPGVDLSHLPRKSARHGLPEHLMRFIKPCA